MSEATRKIEVVQQVKLTPDQRIALMEASNDGGVFKSAPSHSVLHTLRYLGLIEERPKYSGTQLEAARAKDAERWQQLAEVVRKRDVHRAERIINELRSAEYDYKRTCWALTKAGRAYLLNGRVTVTVGESRAKGQAA